MSILLFDKPSTIHTLGNQTMGVNRVHIGDETSKDPWCTAIDSRFYLFVRV